MSFVPFFLNFVPNSWKKFCSQKISPPPLTEILYPRLITRNSVLEISGFLIKTFHNFNIKKNIKLVFVKYGHGRKIKNKEQEYTSLITKNFRLTKYGHDHNYNCHRPDAKKGAGLTKLILLNDNNFARYGHNHGTYNRW